MSDNIPNKNSVGHYFEDFHLHQKFVHGSPRTLSGGDVSLYMALTGSRHLLYSSTPAARSMGLASRPVEELLVYHIAFAKTVPDISVNVMANLGTADLRFLLPVYPGDTVRTESTIIGLDENYGEIFGTVYVRSVGYNQANQPVITWIRWLTVRKRELESFLSLEDAALPQLPVLVSPEHLPIPAGLSAIKFDTRFTGSPFLWEDYVIDERIDHIDRITLDESDHNFSTRLYQNSMRLRFDDHLMKPNRAGRRFICPSHLLSVCRALTHNGLANALCIAAINGITHSNPTFAGETIYAFTEVLDCWELPGRKDLGALRLRTFGVRNFDSTEIETARCDLEERVRYHEHVVLDMDYTVLMPRHR